MQTWDKQIVSDGTYTQGFILSGNNYRTTLAFYQEAAAEAKRDFPHLTDEDIKCSIVTESLYLKRAGLVWFKLPNGTTHSQYSHLTPKRVEFRFA